ncbi:unnamed protein product, partial [Chrysoparadoxa australica]
DARRKRWRCWEGQTGSMDPASLPGPLMKRGRGRPPGSGRPPGRPPGTGYQKLKKVYLVPSSPLQFIDDTGLCSTCLDGNSYKDNELVTCCSCFASVHRNCYGDGAKESLPQGRWQCDQCAQGLAPLR